MSGGGRSRYPFTATQWQELEHQALIFKYMMAGVPVPPDLLFAIKRTSFVTSPDLFSRHQQHQHQHQQIGWNCFQIGIGRKIDPEPGRCRRTDGKKWRCSKEAYPDSKYCERHMHRGKNRSRKPVEATANHKTPSTLTQLPSSENQLLLQYPPAYDNNNNQHHHLSSAHGHPYNLYSSKPPLIGNLHSTQQTLTLNPSGSHANPDYRYIYGGSREEADEHAFFSEPSGTIRNFSGSSLEDSSQLITPLTMTSSSSSKHRASSDYSNYLQLQSLTSSDHNNNNNNNNNNIHNLNTSATTNEQVHKQSQGFYVMGSEIKFGYDREHDPEYQEQLPNHQKTTVHRFFDEWPPKPTPDSSSSSSSNHSSVSNTRLSISIPTSHEFPIFNSRAL